MSKRAGHHTRPSFLLLREVCCGMMAISIELETGRLQCRWSTPHWVRKTGNARLRAGLKHDLTVDIELEVLPVEKALPCLQA